MVRQKRGKRKENNETIIYKYKDATYRITFSTSENEKPYLSVKVVDNSTHKDNSIGIPLSENDAKKMYRWLKEYLYPYAPDN